MKGIVLAGGSGTRLAPLTNVVSKQLLPVYDKPMIYYPLSTLMLAGIREILVISTPRDLPRFHELLGDGSRVGIALRYAEQPKPQGIAQAFLIGARVPGRLGLRAGARRQHLLRRGHGGAAAGARRGAPAAPPCSPIASRTRSATGSLEFDAAGRAVGIEEKPRLAKSRYAVTGLYFYDGAVCDEAARLSPSARGELEITDLNRAYLQRRELAVEKLGRGVAWLDTGTQQSLVQASNYIQAIEERQGLKVACIEEVAYQMGFIGRDHLRALTDNMENDYGQYLRDLLDAGGEPE